MTKEDQRKQVVGRVAGAVPLAARPGSLTEGVARVQREVAKAGFVSDARDDKAVMDEMWGED